MPNNYYHYREGEREKGMEKVREVVMKKTWRNEGKGDVWGKKQGGMERGREEETGEWKGQGERNKNEGREEKRRK